MIISKIELNCFSCRNNLTNPYFCEQCKNPYCNDCKENISNNLNKCPFCHKTPFNPKKNINFNNILKYIGYFCQYCNKVISNIEEYSKHNKGNNYKCILCKKFFLGKYCFIGHIENENKHKKYILSKLGYKIDKSEILNVDNNLNELEEIKKELFNDDNNNLIHSNKIKIFYDEKKDTPIINNNLSKIKIKDENKQYDKKLLNEIDEEETDYISKILITPKIGNDKDINLNCKYGNKISNIKELSKEEKEVIILDALEFGSSINYNYDLFYCYNNSYLNCNCCTNKICEPGKCLCSICMEYSKKYHNLPNHYLINKNGKVSKFTFGNFYCKSKYISIKYNNGNTFKYFDICFYPYNPCKACQELNLIAKTYLGNKLYEKLMKSKGCIIK